MKVLAIVGLVLFVSLLVQPAVSQVPDDKLVVPGVRIGKWTLDMTIDALVEMNGPRNGRSAGVPALRRVVSPDAPSDMWAHRWDNVGLVATTIGSDSQTVVELWVDVPAYKTEKGIGPGSPNASVQTAYGPSVAVIPTAVGRPLPPGPTPGWQTGLYDQIGLAVAVQANVVWHIGVFRPGTAKQIWRW